MQPSEFGMRRQSRAPRNPMSGFGNDEAYPVVSASFNQLPFNDLTPCPDIRCRGSRPPISAFCFPNFCFAPERPKIRSKRCIIRDRRVFLNAQPCFNGLHDRQRKNRPPPLRQLRRIESPHGRRPNRQRAHPVVERIAGSRKTPGEQFAGRPISKQNLSEWKAGLSRRSLSAKAGGHRLWLAGRETLTQAR